MTTSEQQFAVGEQSGVVSDESLRAGHETKLGNVEGLALVVAGLLFLVLFSMLAVWGLWRGLAVWQAQSEPRLFNVNMPLPTLSEPPLDPFQKATLHEWRSDQLKRLSSYGWVDRQHGIAHIPIERAIEVVANEGLPEWEGAAANNVSDSP
jgi:hypothetical protein